jgi:hypothetical protein
MQTREQQMTDNEQLVEASHTYLVEEMKEQKRIVLLSTKS